MGVASPLFKAMKVITGEAAMHLDGPMMAKIASWLENAKAIAKPIPEVIYRGVPVERETFDALGEYAHATPWGSVASRAGKGAWGGNPEAYKVGVFPAGKDMKYYRGGALEGDPLEKTRILNTKGAEFGDILEQAKELYWGDLVRGKKRVQNLQKDYGLSESEIADHYRTLPKSVMEATTSDIRKATYEADIGNKPGIWSGQHVPHELNRPYPKLRSYDDLIEEILKKKKIGYDVEDIVRSPEARILNRSYPEIFKDLIRK